MADVMQMNALKNTTSPPISSSALETHPCEAILDTLLAPLNAESFEQVIDQVKQHLVLFNQMLALLEKSEFEGVLFQILQTVALKLGQILCADRTTIFLRDETQQELWSLVAQDHNSQPIEIRIPDNEGIAGEAVQTGEMINIPYDFYEDSRSKSAQLIEQQTGYRTYSLLTLPIKDASENIIAVVQLLNKCRIDQSPYKILAERIDSQGFTQADEIRLTQLSDAILLLLDSYQAFDRASQKQRMSEALMRVTQYLCEVTLDWHSTVDKVLTEAQRLLNCEYSDIWLIDRQSNDLVFSPTSDTYPDQQSLSQIAQQVLESRDVFRQNGFSAKTLIPSASPVPSIDNALGLPIYNNREDIIGITILVNKTQWRGVQPPGQAAERQIRINFESDDEKFMEVFNRHLGLALERAWRFQDMEDRIQERTAELQQQRQQLQQEVIERQRAEVQLQQANQQLEQLASIDGLTQIENRRHFDQQLAKEWKRMRREQQPLSLILCDVDYFKKYNDTYGHLEGDRCLYQVAQAIRSTLKRPADLVARYGGEEFVVLLPNTPAQGAIHVAELIRQSIEDLKIPHKASLDHHVVTLSLGIACHIPDADRKAIQAFIHRADQGLYRAKKQGRNQAVLAEKS